MRMPDLSLDPDVDIVVDHDPERWLRGPDVDSPPDLRDRWALEAARTYDEAFDLGSLEEGEQVRSYLRQLLGRFAEWDSPAQLRFLRLREPTDTPIPVGVEFYSPHQRADLSTQLDADVVTGLLTPPEERQLVGESSVEDVEDAPGWRRLFYSVLGTDGQVYSFVRYLRVFDSGVMVVFRFGGDSPAIVLEALGDGDALAASISVTSRGGQ
jgi:hypothetical protein